MEVSSYKVNMVTIGDTACSLLVMSLVTNKINQKHPFWLETLQDTICMEQTLFEAFKNHKVSILFHKWTQQAEFLMNYINFDVIYAKQVL